MEDGIRVKPGFFRGRLVLATALMALLSFGRTAVSQAQSTAEIHIAGQPFASAAEAIAAAFPGEVVTIGVGELTLSAPLLLPRGVSLEGASAGATHLVAQGLDAGIRIMAGADTDADGNPVTTIVRGLAIFGATRGIEVSGADGVVIRNVVLRNNVEAGLHVAEDAGATLVNGTLVANGTAVRVLGSAHARNCIIAAGQGGLSASSLGRLTSSYNDLFENTGAAYEHVLRGTGDLAFVATFVGREQNDFHLTPAQAVTDRGDPTDDYSMEPEPRGNRINLGAFGNTAEAELSKVMDPKSGGGCSVVAGGGPADCHWSVAVCLAIFLAASARRRGGGAAFRFRCRASTADCRN